MAKVVGGVVVDSETSEFQISEGKAEETKGSYCSNCFFDWGPFDQICPRPGCGCKKSIKHGEDGPPMKTKKPEPLVVFSNL
jgi:hypothetical protein